MPTRRTFARLSAASLAAAAIRWPELAAQEQELTALNRFPRMVQEYFVEQVRAAEAKILARLDQLETKADAEEYVHETRGRIRTIFGPEPPRTPLNARVTGTVKRDGYRIENVIFESRPEFLVTANLYMPDGSGRFPGVVGTCGHSSNGKAAEAYQSFAQGLVKQGYAVLLYDPIGQGERFQYLDEDLGARLGPGTREHIHAGNQMYLVGEFIGAWRAWDGVRALDYLLSRPEVDPNHVGVTGNSGGGTATTWLCGVESRWTMAAPSCFVTTFRRNLENELPADTEQCPPRTLALGVDHADYIAAMAPKPVILLGKEKDYFDARGLEEAYGRLKRLYTLLGKPENIELFIGPSYHGYSEENRTAMYGWFNRATGIDGPKKEPSLTMEDDETLWCTPKGQVGVEGSRRVYSFTAERARSLGESRPAVRGRILEESVSAVLRLPSRAGVPDYRILRPRTGRGYAHEHAVSYAVETEPGIRAIVTRLHYQRLLSRPPHEGRKRAVLYVSDHSADEELRSEVFLRDLFAEESTPPFYGVDVRGIGDSRPDTTNANSFLSPYGSDYFYSAHSLMLDRPYLGQRTFDVLRTLDWLADIGHPSVHLAGMGWGSLPAAFAATLHPLVSRVTLKGSPASYEDLAETEFYDYPLALLPRDILSHFDLPDVYRALRRKNLRRLD